MSYEVISANYNNAKFLAAYFDSIINSTLKPLSIIIVDDCSQDNSLEIIRAYEKIINIKLIENNTNIGFANSLNLALKKLEAPFYARLDPDDQVHTDRFSQQIDFLSKNPEIDIVGSNVSYILNGHLKINSDVDTIEAEINCKIRKGILPVIHGSIMGRTSKLNGFQYKQEFVPAEDYDFFAFIVANDLRVTNTADALTFVTVHENSVSNDLKLSTIKKRFELSYFYFNYKKNILALYLDYIHLLNYRRFLFESTFKKYLYLFYSASVMPKKSFKKFLKKVL